MNTQKIKAKIVDTFDLGYLLKLEDGRDGQLRVPEIKQGESLDLQIQKSEEQIIGRTIEAFIVKEVGSRVLLSEFTKEERERRDYNFEQRWYARKKCSPGDTFDVEIIAKIYWGYIFQQVDGYLEHALYSENISAELTIGDKVTVKVNSINENGYPVFHLAMKN